MLASQVEIGICVKSTEALQWGSGGMTSEKILRLYMQNPESSAFCGENGSHKNAFLITINVQNCSLYVS